MMMLLLFADDPVTDIANDSAKKLITTIIVSGITSLVAFLFGRYYGRYKARREWMSKEFLHRVIVSLNIFADGFLKIRTVLERSLESVFLNPVAIEKVQLAAKDCTKDQSMLIFPKEDRWFILNFVLNAVAEQFVQGQVKQDAGVPVTKVKYALFLTCEVLGDERIRKIRAMLIQQQHLEQFPYQDSLPKLENPWHEDRIRTLRQAAELYAKEPDLFLMIEFCV
jgi:hypothetical protein